MKILQVITSLRTGGAEKLIVDMVPRYRERGYDVDVLLFDGERTPFREELEHLGVKVLDLGRGSVYSPLKLFRLLPFLRKYDIVHTHNTAPQLFAAVGSVFCPVVLVTTEHSTSNRRRDWKWNAPVDRWMYGRYDKIICISDKVKENLATYLGVDKNMVTIYNGIDCAKYGRAKPYQELRESGKVIVTMVAGFRYQKDQDTLIKAVARLPENYELWLIGDGERRQVLENLAIGKGVSDRVQFWGIRDDIPEMLKTSDIIVMSSHWEGFGLAAVEGMAVGNPVVASNVPGLAEVVGRAGVLFPHGDDKVLADMISRLVNDEVYYHHVADRCRSRAAHYDISYTVNAYLKVYNEMIM